MLDNYHSKKIVGRNHLTRHFDTKSAFTLMEVVITMTVFFILSTLGARAYFQFQSNSILNTDIFNVARFIENTQAMALKNPYHSGYGIYFDTSNLRLIRFRDTYVPDHPENVELVFDAVNFIDLNLDPTPGVSDQILFLPGTAKVEHEGSFTVGHDESGVDHTFSITLQGAIE